MDRKFVIIAGIMGFLGVVLGAFGAHGLSDVLSEKLLETYKTGILYHLVHSVVLLAIALNGKEKFINSYWFFLAGIILFSFSLYFYSITEIKFFAMITPVGGVSFLIGWVLIVLSGVQKKSS